MYGTLLSSWCGIVWATFFPKLVETYTEFAEFATSVAISFPSCKNSEALVSCIWSYQKLSQVLCKRTGESDLFLQCRWKKQMEVNTLKTTSKQLPQVAQALSMGAFLSWTHGSLRCNSKHRGGNLSPRHGWRGWTFCTIVLLRQW